MKAILKNNSKVTLHGVKPGEQVEIDVDSSGVPNDQHWRRRIKDAVFDACVTIEMIKPKSTSKAKGDAE